MTIKNIWNILRVNQRVLTMIFLTKIILILQYLVLWQKKLYETKNKNKSNELVELIKDRWSHLKDKIEKMSKDEIEKMSKNEIEYEKLDKILKIVEEILDFNKKNSKTTGFGAKNTYTKPNAQQITNYFSTIKGRK